MQKLLILFLISLSVIPLQGQDLGTSIFAEGNVIPPSPNATAFNKFIDVPVGHYTGIPNVSVPIYTIQLPHMSLPISLNYHAGGLKVGEHSSWVGAGWSLNAGGSVNRTVRGLPDEWIGSSMAYTDHGDGSQVNSDLRRGFFRMSADYFDSDLHGIDVNTFYDCPEPTGDVVDRIPKGPQTDTDHFSDGIYDTEPDLWHFGFPGGSGKFVFNRNMELVPFQDDDNYFHKNAYTTKTIGPTGDWLLADSYFKISDNRGITYTFTATESLNTGTECGDIRAIYNDVNIATISTWHLTKMEFGGNWIEFQYDNESITYEATFSNSKTFTLSGPAGNPITSTCMTTRIVGGKRLRKIKASNGVVVDFIADTNDRSDLPGSKRLTSVRVMKHNKQMIRYDLGHSYFSNDTKLRLDSVYQVDNLNPAKQLPAYKFDYHGNVPDLDSFKQDYWGFFNNASGNVNDMVPEWRTPEYHVNLKTLVSREPNLAATQAGTMYKITYPTGGYANFIYELNDYYSPGDTAVFRQTLTTPQYPGNTKLTFTVSDTTTVSFIRDTEIVQEDDDPLAPEDIGIDQYVNLQRCSGPNYTNCQTVTLEKTLGNRWNLPAGDYQLYAETRQGADPNVSNTLTVVYEQEKDYSSKLAGGLRIKRIKTNDGITGQTIEKAYQYREGDHSSGLLFTLPYVLGSVSTYIHGKVYGMHAIPYCSETGKISTSVSLSSSPSVSTGTYQGSHIGYSQVQEFYVEAGTNTIQILGGKDMPQGMTEYLFENHKPASYNVDPYVPAEDLSYINGKPAGQKVYKYKEAEQGVGDKGGTGLYENLIKLSESSMVYSIGQNDSLKSKGLRFKRDLNRFCYDCEDVYGFDQVYAWQYYEMIPKYALLVSQTTTNYDEEGNNPLTTLSEFEYDLSRGHHEYVTMKTTDSFGDMLRADVERSSIPTLIEKREVFRENAQVAGERITYLYNLPSSYSVWNQELEGTPLGIFTHDGYESVKSFKYNSIGMLQASVERPLAVQPDTTLYLWSYDSMRMVASIANISLPELDNLLADFNYSRGDLLKETSSSIIKLRLLTNLKSRLLTDQPMTVYLYDNYGVTQITDPNGKSTYYEYDSFGRLIRVKDNDLNILQQNEYNYKNQ